MISQPNFWAFLCTPTKYRINDVLAEQEFDTWRVKKHKVKAGDRALIWKAKANDANRGIIAFAEILSDPQIKLSPNPEYYVDHTTGEYAEMRVDIRYVLLPNLPLWYNGDASSPLGQLSCGRATGGSVFIVTPQQWQAVMQLAGDWQDNARLAQQQNALLLAQQKNLVEAQQGFDPSNIVDARKRIMASIALRSGQSKFRQSLIQAYSGKCAITGCDIAEILEAAHISPFKGTATNHICNGLLLRADLHTLFDMGLISVDTSTMQIVVSKQLSHSEYATYNGKMLHLPQHVNAHPNKAALDLHRIKYGL